MELIEKYKPYTLLEYTWDNKIFILGFLFGIFMVVKIIIDHSILKNDPFAYEDFKDDLPFKVLATTILIITLPISLSVDYFNNFEHKQPVSIVEIKDHIKIENDKLTINPLPEEYYYKKCYLNKNESHDFKIDTFYTDSDIKLIDKKKKEYTISKNELEELKRK